jgi:hypothetical protein
MNYDIDKMALSELIEFKKKVIDSMRSHADRMPLYEEIDRREWFLRCSNAIIETSEECGLD